MVVKLKLTRDQLADFLPDEEAVRQFEKLFKTSSESATSLEDLLSTIVALQANAGEEKDFQIQQQAEQIGELERRLSDLEGLIATSIGRGGDDPLNYLETKQVAVDNKVGRLNWTANNNFSAGIAGIDMPLGLLTMARMENASGINLTAGRVVRVSGSNGTLPRFNLAGCETAFDAIGVTTTAINNGAVGYVTCTGVIENMDATGAPVGEVWIAGDTLYIGIGSALTNALPAKPFQQVAIGRVLSASSILVFPNRDMRSDKLSDMVAGAYANGQLMIYDNAVGVWRNATLTAGAGGVTITNTAGAITLALSNITNNQAARLIRSSVTLNDGAGAAAGTITNAPTVGNPTKWVPIDDNGTTRHIPAW